MKKLIAALIFALTVGSAMAQTATEKQSATTKVITGAVIDKNGNPLPGAIVSATGGAETVTADADGTFTIEVPIWLKSLTASYPGLGETKMKTNALNQMIFTLKSRKRTHGFINLVGQYRTQISSGLPVPAQGEFGIMGGAYRSWGGYVKVVIRCVGGGIKDPDYFHYEDEERFDVLPTTTFGVIKRLSNKFAVFLGGGVGFDFGGDAYGICDGYDYKYDPVTDDYTEVKDHDPHYRYATQSVTGVAEVGGLFRISNKLNVTAGVSYIMHGCEVNNNGNLGIFLGFGLNL